MSSSCLTYRSTRCKGWYSTSPRFLSPIHQRSRLSDAIIPPPQPYRRLLPYCSPAPSRPPVAPRNAVLPFCHSHISPHAQALGSRRPINGCGRQGVVFRLPRQRWPRSRAGSHAAVAAAATTAAGKFARAFGGNVWPTRAPYFLFCCLPLLNHVKGKFRVVRIDVAGTVDKLCESSTK